MTTTDDHGRELIRVRHWGKSSRYGFGVVEGGWTLRDVLLHQDRIGRRLHPNELVWCRLVATDRGLRAEDARPYLG